MSIDSTPLDFDIRRVLDSKKLPNTYDYRGEFKIGEKTVPILKLLSIDNQSDYELSFASVITATVVVPLGDYSKLIYPSKEKLEFILKTEKLNYNYSDSQEDSTLVMTYNVSLDPELRPFMSEDNNNEDLPKDIQNLIDFVEFEVQLKPKLVDDINKVVCGGQYLNTTTSDVIRDAISLHCAQLELDDDQKLLGVNVHNTASEDVHPTVIIEHGTLLQDLADYVHIKQGGVFPAGMAQFVHDRVWYIYPPYDTKGYDEALNKMTIISVPAKRYPQVEKTYIAENGMITVLSTGNKRIKSDKSQIQDNAGNGVMFTDANQILSGFSKGGTNTSLVRRSQNNSEFLGEAKSDGKNNVRMSPERITSNPYLANSRLARSQGHFYTLEWENADPTLIRPGLNIKILYLNEGEVREVNGVLLKSHIQTKLMGKGMMASGYRSFAALVVFVKDDGVADSGFLGFE